MAEEQTAPPTNKTGRDAAPVAVHLERYSERNSRLQTWIGGCGVGFASLLVYQFRTAFSNTQALWQAKGATAAALSGQALSVVLANMHQDLLYSLRLVAVAIAIQVGLLTLNKHTQLAQAHVSDDDKQWSWWEQFSIWCCNQSWIELRCELASIGLLALATVFGLEALGIQP